MQNFNFHSHTYRCKHADMDYTDEEYVQDYIKMGFKKIAFTDHCPEKLQIDKRPTMRMDYEQRLEYYDSIKYLQEKYAGQIEILSGFEIEYLPEELETLKQLKSETDILVLGQHFIYDDNGKLKIFKKINHFTDKEFLRYAEFVKTAIELGLPNIVVHPDIFMLSRSKFDKIGEEIAHTICQTAEKHGTILEINLNGIFANTYYKNPNAPIEKQRKQLEKVKYPCREFWKIVSNYDIKVVYGIDAHHRHQISVFNELVTLANEIIGEETIGKLKLVSEM